MGQQGRKRMGIQARNWDMSWRGNRWLLLIPSIFLREKEMGSMVEEVVLRVGKQ